MFHHDCCTQLICSLPRVGADFQHLAKRAKAVSSRLSGVMRARVGDDDDPQGVAPAGMAIGGEDTGNAPCNRFGVILREYDNPDSLDFRCRAGMRISADACWSWALRHAARIANPR